MKIKKFPQSHLVLTKGDKKLNIDPGYYTFQKGFSVNEFQGADVYLITHSHDDHLGPETIKEVVGDAEVVGNVDVTEKLNSVGVANVKTISNGEKFSSAGFEIQAVDLEHFPSPTGQQMPPNTGFIIDGVFFHSGDGFETEGVKAETVALPIGHPSVSTTGVLKFAQSLGAKVLIPIHYDAFPRDPAEVKKFAESVGIEVRILNDGDETEIV